MTTCPSCGGEAMSAFAKSFLGPARSVPCRACGARIGTPWKAFWIYIPVVILMVGAFIALESSAYVAILPLILVNAYVWYKFVPLELREPKATPTAN